MSKFGGLGRRGGGGGGGNFSENVAFQVKEINVADVKNPSPDDHVIALILHDINGLQATFDAAGNPTTELKIKYRDGKSVSAKRPTFGEYKKGKNNSAPMQPGSLGIADSVYVDSRTGEATTSWLRRWFPEPTENDVPMPNVMVSVRREWNRDGKSGQNRFVINPDDALTFSGMEDFRNKAVSILESLKEAAGEHGVMLRMINLTAPDEGATVDIMERWDGDNGRTHSPVDSLKMWLDGPTGQQWAGYIEAADPEVLYEVIPVLRARTGNMSLPSVRMTDAKVNVEDLTRFQKMRYDDSVRYEIPMGENVEYGFALSHIGLSRKVDEGQSGPWFALGGTIPTRDFPVLMRATEVITPNLPKAIAEKYLADATARSSRAPAQEPAPDNSPAPATM